MHPTLNMQIERIRGRQSCQKNPMNLVAAVWEQVVEKTLSSVANMEGEEGEEGGRGVSDSA